MIKAVVFDFDGTLADSSEGIFSTACQVMRDMGYNDSWTEKQLRKFVGPPLKECFRITFGLAEDKLDEAVDRYRAIYKCEGYLKCSLYPGIKELVLSLRLHGFKIGIATNKEQLTIEACIKALGVEELFDAVYGTDLKGTLKKSDVIALSCKTFGLLPSEVLMVGDTENDRNGAMKANTDFVGVTWGFGYTMPWALDDVYYVQRPEDILNIIDRMNGGSL